jgi:hypothetical protein
VPRDRVGDLAVDVGERLEEGLRVPGGETGDALRLVAEVGVAAPQQLHRPVERRVPQLVRVLLVPAQRTGLAVDLQHQVVLVPDLDLRGHQHALGAARKRSSRLPSSSSRRPGTKVVRSAQIASSSSPVTVATRFSACEPMSPMAPAAPLRAGSVRHSACLAPSSSSFVGEPALVVADHDLADRVRCAPRARAAHLLHHRVAGVVVGDAEHDAALARDAHQLVGLRAGVHQRLVGDDVDAGLGEGLGDRVVDVVRGDDDDQVDALARGGPARPRASPPRWGSCGRREAERRAGAHRAFSGVDESAPAVKA